MFNSLKIAAMVSAMALPAAALDLTAMSDEERANFRAEVRAYLLDNPEIIMEAVAILREREAQAQELAAQEALSVQQAALYDNPGDWVGGNPDGDVTIVEFMDYRCGFCKRSFPEVRALVEEDGNIRLIVKEFPILGPQSELASRFAIATLQVMGAESYELVHTALMTLRGEITPETLGRIADEAGFDPAEVLAAMNSAPVNEVIDTNRALAGDLQITGTPTFIMGNELVRGAVPREEMEVIIASAREERG